jgi:lipoprotein-anchoring transpeptidase ErfK/SrfK
MGTVDVVRGRWPRGVAAVGVLLAAALLASACSNNHGATPTGGVSPAAATSSDAAGSGTTTSGGSSAPAVVTVPATVGGTGSAGPGSGGTSGAAAPSSSLLPSTSVTPSSSSSLLPPPPPAATVKGSPALGTQGILPTDRVTIAVTGGTIKSLSFTNAEGTSVSGTLSSDKKSWTLGQDLGYGRTYTVNGSAVNSAGATTPIKGTYSTVSTIEPITTTITPGDGAVVGVATPIIVTFGMRAQDKALVEQHVHITTTPKVEGSWAWIQHDGYSYSSLDWRPKTFWPTGTKVHVEADIYGVKFADGWYGGNDTSVDFTIGRNQVVYADAKTHMVTVKRDGKTVATYPASFGMGDDPNSAYGLMPAFVTRSGTYIVMNKQQKILMSNPKPGGGWYYHNVPEYWAVRISNDGEFLHYNQDTTSWELANVNKTHGCINLGEQDAEDYYNSAIYGDPVIVTGTSVPLSSSDGDIYDWAIPWSQWQNLSALSAHSTVNS